LLDYPHVKHRKCRSRHRQHHKVASHATALTGVHNSLEAGVDTIDYISDEDLKTMAARAVYYVPTIHVGVYVGLKILSARWIRRKEDHFSSEYAGREYHFCSEECKDAFDRQRHATSAPRRHFERYSLCLCRSAATP
jgi:YHS domain-containing protein